MMFINVQACSTCCDDDAFTAGSEAVCALSDLLCYSCTLYKIHTDLCMTSKVCLAISCGVGWGWVHATPGMIICSLRRQASRHTPLCLNDFTQHAITCSDAAANLSMEWSPSISSSGSTIGTRLHACITCQAVGDGRNSTDSAHWQ